MDYAIGARLALVVSGWAALVGFDRDRVFTWAEKTGGRVHRYSSPQSPITLRRSRDFASTVSMRA